MTIQFKDSVTAKGYSVIEINLENIKRSGLAVEGSRWCCWSATWEAGRDKPAKIPCNTRGKAIRVSTPSQWGSFGEIAAGYQGEMFEGVGLLMESFAEISGALVGLDLDKCLAADGSIEPAAADVVADFVALDGYIEYSPSGRGLRQFLKGVRLDDYKEKCKVHGAFDLEVYDPDSDRYLTVTGVVYPEGSEAGSVVENQAELEAFIGKWCERKPQALPLEFDINAVGNKRTAAEVITLLRKYDKSGKATRLLEGDCSDYDDGRSEADLALCSLAAFYCRNPETIDAVVRGSGLMREKWERKDYRNRTISNALKWQTNHFDAMQASTKVDKAAAQAQRKTADEFLIGGAADLRTRNGWKKDIWALSELLLRDRRLLGVCYWNEFSSFPMLTSSIRQAFDDRTAPDTVGSLIDCHYRAVQAWFGRHYGIAIKKDIAAEVVARWSQAGRRNPAIERLEELAAAWDGVARLDDWLLTYCKAETTVEGGADISDYVRAVGSRWVLSVVARAMVPGCKVDCMLILEGKQGARKSSAVRALAEVIGPEYFREGFHLGEGAGKDAKISLRGRLVVEWGELSGMGRKDRNELKTFLSQQTDSYRGVYGIAETDWPRTAVFCGTTNDAHYLSDPSGNRRFWPVKIGRIDLEKLRAEAGQLWGEAVARYRSGGRWWFDDADPRDMKLLRIAAAEQGRRVSSGMWEELGADLADKLVKGELSLIEGGDAEYVKGFEGEQMRSWLNKMVEGGGAIDDVVWLRVAEGLRRSGWESYKSGRMRWRLTVERREELCLLWDVDTRFRNQSLKQLVAQTEADKAIETARLTAQGVV